MHTTCYNTKLGVKKYPVSARGGGHLPKFQYFIFHIYSDSDLVDALYIKLRGLSPRANYTDRAAAAGRGS